MSSRRGFREGQAADALFRPLRRRRAGAPWLAFLTVLGCGSAPAPIAPPAPTAVAPAAPPSDRSDIDPTAIDSSVSPCDDFYQYACGAWLARTPIPPDQPMWSRGFNVVAEANQNRLRGILEAYAAGTLDPADPNAQKLGDYYATCMDEQKAETASEATLKTWLAKVAAIKSPIDLARVLAELHLAGVRGLFRFRSDQDAKDAARVIGLADQGGLELPDRDYYLKDDPKSVQIRNAYGEHVAKLLALAGIPAAEAAGDAKTVLAIETALAKASLSRVERRDPYNLYHRLERAGLEKKAPRFAWMQYFEALGIPGVTEINVAVPGFFAGLDELLGRTKPAELRAYLRWHLVRDATPALGKRFVEEAFRFRSANLSGEQQNLPRWKRCVAATDDALGDALGRPFVRDAFGADGKASALAIIEDIQRAFAADLETLSWMDEPTRAAARQKARRIENLIGYPDKWRDYGRLEIDRGSYLANRLRASELENRRQLDKIGKPLDRREFTLTPATVNASYEPTLNEMFFPAGILQPPFFKRGAGITFNYGAIGMIMGHELTHGFDDEGGRYDGLGNLREWWSPPVAKAYAQRAACLVKQYDGYIAVADVHVNGKLTLGENIADLGGLKLAYAARKAAGGLGEDRDFFLAFAQTWCINRREAAARVRAITDPHSPPAHRVNGAVSNFPEFAAAFACKPGSKMAPAEQCAVW